MQNHCFVLHFTLLADFLNINSANTSTNSCGLPEGGHITGRMLTKLVSVWMRLKNRGLPEGGHSLQSHRLSTKGSGSTSSRCYPRRGRSLTVKSGNWEAGFIAKDLKGGGFLFLVKKSTNRRRFLFKKSAARWL